jgi:hypothetical protein
MEFDKRLEKAIERGQRRSDAREQEAAQAALSEEELRRLHSQHRLALSEHIEHCLRALPQHFPGFRYETIVGERGWGAAIRRDDLIIQPGRGKAEYFSRLEMVIRPYSSAHILELQAKGTIRNKEAYQRSHYQRLSDIDITSFSELIDLWVLEYAEQYAAIQ